MNYELVFIKISISINNFCLSFIHILCFLYVKIIAINSICNLRSKIFSIFFSEELTSYPKKKYATFWECENYPKAWGHGSNKNPLPTDSVARETGPMRDTLVFKSAATIPRIPKRSKQTPNT